MSRRGDEVIILQLTRDEAAVLSEVLYLAQDVEELDALELQVTGDTNSTLIDLLELTRE